MTSGLYRELKSGYDRSRFLRDVSAGFLVGIVAIPMNIAFAIGSGVSPEIGLLAGVVSSFVLSFLGGSSTQVSGPTGAFMGIIYGIVSLYGLEGLITATFLAGLIILVLGLLRLGRLFQFIPFSVVIGFTGGIAVIIFTSQINDLLGLGIDKLPKEFIEKWIVYAEHMSQINPYALGIAILTILGIVIMNKIDRRIPAALIMILIATSLDYLFNLPLTTIGSRFGAIRFQLPTFRFPFLDLGNISGLILPAISIALLGGIGKSPGSLPLERARRLHDPARRLNGSAPQRSAP